MKISAPERIQCGDEVKYRVEVGSPNYPEVLWYRVSKQHGEFLSARSDAALVALLIPAMKTGEDIRVAGVVSERLYYNLVRPCQAVLQEIHPVLQPIDVYPKDVRPATGQVSGVATGFSAGVDSFSVLADHFYTDEVPAGFRVTHLLLNNVGSYGHGDKANRLFEGHLSHVRPITEQIGLPLIAVNSNVSAFYPEFPFSETHTLRNTSVAHLLQERIGRFLYASGHSYSNVFVGESNAIAHSDPVTLPLLSNQGLDALAVGSAYTRVEKTLQITEIEDSHQALDVCTHSSSGAARNCSTCWKCRRTMLTLEIAGELDRYDGVFDLDVYWQDRDRYIAKVLQSSSPYAQEIISFAREENYSFPLTSKVKSSFLKVKNVAKKVQPLKRVTESARSVLPKSVVKTIKIYK